MAREPLPLGTAGKVARRQVSNTRWIARALFRDADGKTRQVEASGSTGAKAEKALKEKIRDRSGLFGGEITPETRMHVLVDKWIEDLGHSELRPQTRDEYARLARTTILPALGQLRVREISVSRVEFFLRAIEHDQNKPALARNAYVLLKQIVQVAVRHDVLAFNPVDNARQPRKVQKEVRSLNELELAAVRRAVRQWQAGYGKPGPKPTTLMPDAIDLLLATALRIGELLALRWRDVDFAATPPTLTVSGTLVEVKGQSLFRQEFPKTAAGHRILTLPEFAVSMLRRRRAETSDDRDDAPIFQSRTGGWFYPANFGRLWHYPEGARPRPHHSACFSQDCRDDD